MLDFCQPAEGFCYLDQTRWFMRDLKFFNQHSNFLKVFVVTFHRTLKCFRRSAELFQKPRYTDQTMTTLLPSPLHELGPGETERPSGLFYDWTRDWEFSLLFRCRSKTADGRWRTAFTCLYFNGLSPHGDVAIPWKDPFKTGRLGSDVLPSELKDKESGERTLRFSWQFVESTPPRRWGASIMVFYRVPRDAKKG